MDKTKIMVHTVLNLLRVSILDQVASGLLHRGVARGCGWRRYGPLLQVTPLKVWPRVKTIGKELCLKLSDFGLSEKGGPYVRKKTRLRTCDAWLWAQKKVRRKFFKGNDCWASWLSTEQKIEGVIYHVYAYHKIVTANALVVSLMSLRPS